MTNVEKFMEVGYPLRKGDLEHFYQRLLKEWSDEDIITDLHLQNRIKDADLFEKFLKIGYKGLKGGNVICKDSNVEINEYARVARIIKEYGQMAPDITILYNITEAEFKESCKELNGDKGNR